MMHYFYNLLISSFFITCLGFGQEQYLGKDITLIPNIKRFDIFLDDSDDHIPYTGTSNFVFMGVKFKELNATANRNDVITAISFNLPKKKMDQSLFDKIVKKYGKPNSMTKIDYGNVISEDENIELQVKSVSYKSISCTKFEENPQGIYWYFNDYKLSISLYSENSAHFIFKVVNNEKN